MEAISNQIDGLNEFKEWSDLVKFYSESLQFLWGQYLKAVHLMITFSLGTIYVLIKDFKLAENNKLLLSKPLWVWGTMASAAFSLVFALLWRSTTQVVMEHQIYGLKTSARLYFDKAGAKKPVALRNDDVKWQENWNERLKILTIVFLAAAWGGMIFILI